MEPEQPHWCIYQVYSLLCYFSILSLTFALNVCVKSRYLFTSLSAQTPRSQVHSTAYLPTDALAYNLNLAFSLVNQNHSGNKHFSFVNRNKTLCLLKKSLSKISLFEAMLSGVVDPGQSSETRRAVRAKKSNRRMSACFSQKKSMSEKPDRELSALK